jgi:translation initiation factor IF-3
MRKVYRTKKKPDKKPTYPKNEKIQAPEVRLIDENGKRLGIKPTDEALNIAYEKGLDLVLVSPKAQPPVAKFLDFGKFVYQQEKQLQKQKLKHKKTEVKVVRLSLRIGKHDLKIRVEQAIKFLQKGHKVKIELVLRGRELQHIELGKKLLNDFLDQVKEQIEFEIETPIEKQGNKFITLINNKK